MTTKIEISIGCSGDLCYECIHYDAVPENEYAGCYIFVNDQNEPTILKRNDRGDFCRLRQCIVAEENAKRKGN